MTFTRAERMPTPNQSKKTSGTGVSPVHSVQEPVLSFQVTRRNLPHWQEPGRVYFITWRCQRGQTLSPQERTITLDALRHWDGRKLTLYAAVVMPDHVHSLVQPCALPESEGVYDLAEIIHSVKSFSVHKINRQRGSSGSIWQDERFDRIVRDEAEFLEKWQYLRNNPMTAGLAESPEDYLWLYEKS